MISILIPTIRPGNIPALIDAIRENAGIAAHNYEINVIEDVERQGCPKTLKQLVDQSNGGLVCFIGDDTIPQPDFLQQALITMQTLPDGWGVVGLNSQPSKHAAHFLADKRMLDLLPDREFFSTQYAHCWCDHELSEIAESLGRYAFCEKSVLKHNHPAFKTAPSDADYDRVYSRSVWEKDQQTYFRRKRKRNGQKLAIGFPLIDKAVSIDFMVSFVAMEKPDYTLLMPKFAVGEFPKDIAAVRNNLVEQAQYEGCTHILMLDTDQVYRDDQTIVKMLSHSLPVVGAPVHRRYPPFDAILLRGTVGKYKYIKDDEVYGGGLIDIDATGTGCILFDMDVFDLLDKPWFHVGIDKETGKTVGEDIGLCSRLKEKGVRICADTSIEIGHLTQFEVNRKTYELYKAVIGFQKNI